MGQMNKPFMDLDQQSLQAEVNSYKPGMGLAWSQLFPLKYTPKFTLKGIDGDDGLPVSADIVSFDSRSKDKTRKKTGAWELELRKIMISRSKNEIEINEYKDAKRLAEGTTDAAAKQYIVDMVYNDVKFCNDGMDARVEVEAMQVGSLGKRVYAQKFDGDMVEQEELDFNVPSSNFIGATVAWSSASTADGLADIARGYKMIRSKGGKAPRYAIMTQSAFDLLCAQDKVIKKVAPMIVKATGLDAADLIGIDTINAYMSKKGYPQILVVDPYVIIEDADGNQHTEQPWNANSVVLSPEPRLGYTYWKTVPTTDDTAAMQAYGSYYLTTRYGEVNPKKETTLAEAYVQPGLSNRRWLVFLNCGSTTWNDGE